MTQPGSPASTGKRMCGICRKPLSMYNKSDICMSHKAEDVVAYREKVARQDKRSRAIQSFIKEFHKESTAQDMLAAAAEAEQTPTRKRAVTELAQYSEALGVLKVASLIFRLSMPGILRKKSTSSKPKVARDVVSYIMRRDLKMKPEEIALILGYHYLPRVAEGVDRVSQALLEDEDIICAVDLVREEYHRQYEDTEPT